MKQVIFAILACSVVSGTVTASVENSAVKSFQVKKVSFNLDEEMSTKNKEANKPIDATLPVEQEILVAKTEFIQEVDYEKPQTELLKPVVKVKRKAPIVYRHGNFLRYESDGRVEFTLKAGPLKSQVIELLLNHKYVDSLDDIQWLASSNFVWPNSHTLKGKTIDHVLNDLLKPYRLVADFKGNGTVVIDNI